MDVGRTYNKIITELNKVAVEDLDRYSTEMSMTIVNYEIISNYSLVCDYEHVFVMHHKDKLFF